VKSEKVQTGAAGFCVRLDSLFDAIPGFTVRGASMVQSRQNRSRIDPSPVGSVREESLSYETGVTSSENSVRAKPRKYTDKNLKGRLE